MADDKSRKGGDQVGNEESRPGLEREDADEVEVIGLCDQNQLVVGTNYYPTVKGRVKNHEGFSTSVFSSLFISEDYGLAHSNML